MSKLPKEFTTSFNLNDFNRSVYHGVPLYEFSELDIKIILWETMKELIEYKNPNSEKNISLLGYNVPCGHPSPQMENKAKG